ncbi:MAG: cytochrome P450 [Sphingomonadaceae bacterium]
MATQASGCPAHQGRDERKSAALADANLTPIEGSRVIGDFEAAREIYRSPKVRQWGAGSAEIDLSNPGDISFFFLDGPEHRKRRGGVAGMFTPKAIAGKHREVMERRWEAIEAKLRRDGKGVLDEMSWDMAVDVAATIIGLTESDSLEGLAQRVKAVLDSSMDRRPGLINKLKFAIKSLVRVGRFWKQDLSPAIEARKKDPRDDLVTFMVQENYSKKGMLMEALSYGGAGMMTTREFIVMAAWHMFDNPDLRARFLESSEADQIAILEEILRLEPVASLNHRKAMEPLPNSRLGEIPEGELLCLNIREMNTDEAITGECPYQIDPDRAKKMKVVGPYMSFGDGPHRCPGAQVAMHESRVFLDRLFRLPGIRLEKEPEISWNPHIQGYELRGAIVAVDRA